MLTLWKKKYLLLINASFYIRCNRYIVIGVVIMYFLSNIFFLILSVGIGIYKIKLKNVLINYCIYLLLMCFRRQNEINSGVKKWKKDTHDNSLLWYMKKKSNSYKKLTFFIETWNTYCLFIFNSLLPEQFNFFGKINLILMNYFDWNQRK